MTTKKQKRLAGIAKREKFEAEQRERGLHFLKLAQTERAQEKAKAEEQRKQRAIAKSQKLAREHRAQQAAAASKPGQHVTTVGAIKQNGGPSKRKKRYQKAKNPKRGPRLNGTDQPQEA